MQRGHTQSKEMDGDVEGRGVVLHRGTLGRRHNVLHVVQVRAEACVRGEPNLAQNRSDWEEFIFLQKDPVWKSIGWTIE